MTWIKKQHRIWRISILLFMILAFLGPWAHDRIFVPSEYECSAPNIRLDDKFCGIPLSGIRIFSWIITGYISFWVGFVKGEFTLPGSIREFVFPMLPLLPIFTTLLLVLRGDQRRIQVFTIIVWILAIGFGLFLGLSNHPHLFWTVWGIWLYIGVAISALVFEIITIRK